MTVTGGGAGPAPLPPMRGVPRDRGGRPRERSGKWAAAAAGGVRSRRAAALALGWWRPPPPPCRRAGVAIGGVVSWEVFVRCDRSQQEKHFPRWAGGKRSPLYLVTTNTTAATAAAVIIVIVRCETTRTLSTTNRRLFPLTVRDTHCGIPPGGGIVPAGEGGEARPSHSREDRKKEARESSGGEDRGPSIENALPP